MVYDPQDGYVGLGHVTYIVCDDGLPSLCDTAYIKFDMTDNFSFNEELIAVNAFNYQINPNPNNGCFNILIPTENTNANYIHVFNANGKLIKSKTNKDQSNAISFDMTDVASGIYFIEITNDNRKIVKRFVKY